MLTSPSRIAYIASMEDIVAMELRFQRTTQRPYSEEGHGCHAASAACTVFVENIFSSFYFVLVSEAFNSNFNSKIANSSRHEELNC
jgi:hypothetical protein